MNADDDAAANIAAALRHFYCLHKDDRDAYKRACDAKCQEKGMPRHLIDVFLQMALETFDAAKEQGF
jgi:hypothetical protein